MISQTGVYKIMAEASDYELLELRIKELEKENSYLRLFKFGVDNMPNARFAVCNREYRFEAISKGYFEAFNKREDQILGKLAIEILGAKMFQEIVKPNFDRALKGEVVNYSTWFELPGSKKRFLNVQYYPVHNRDEINLIAILIQDLTEKKKIQESLKRSEIRYRDLFEGAPMMYVVLENHQGRPIITDCNHQFLVTLGYDREEVIGKYISEFYTRDSQKKMMIEHNYKRIEENTFTTAERELIRRDGDIVITLMQGASEYDGWGNSVGARCMYNNISSQKRAEEQLKENSQILLTIEKELVQADKMISLGVLVSGVAHEINNPNNFIMLNTPILWDAWKGIGPVIEKYYEENGDFNLAGLPYSRMRNEIPLLFSGVESGATRIQRIVQDLKNFARQDDSDMDQPLNINQIIKKSIQLTENLIKEKTTHFKVEYTKCLPSIKGNGQKLEQVMINLIENACQSLPQKERGVFITASFDKKKQSIVVEVRDEGVGIPGKFIDRIMDPFFTTKRSEGGTGLGLAVSSNIVKAHGGKIEVASEIAKGSIFRIVIPKSIKDKLLEVEQ